MGNWTWQEDGTTIVRSIARTGPGCHEGCGVLLYVKDGVLVRVKGDPDFPASRGHLCPRCGVLPQVVYHPDRLKYPLKRAEARGEGKWQRITWEEALDTIATKFNEIKSESGAESVIFCQGTGRDIMPYLTRLAFTFGSPNRFCFGPLHGQACFLPKVATTSALLGGRVVADCAQFFPERYSNAEWQLPRLFLVWGNETLNSSPDGFMGYWLTECLKKGSDMVVIDPRKTALAERARLWLQLRPGTDAALALGMLNVIINEGLYDREFVEKWTYGFDRLKERAQDFPPDKVAAITWVPESKIVEAAHLYAKARPAAIQWGVSIEQSKECVSTIHAITSLWTITGNLDVPGGNIITGRNFNSDSLRLWGLEWLNKEQKDKTIGSHDYPLLRNAMWPRGEALIDQALSGRPYPVRGAWIQTTNTFVCGTADVRRTYQAFKNIEFNVVVDLFMTPTAMAFADIVLPAAAYPERDGLAITGGIASFIGTINKAIEPVGECKSDAEINLLLGRRLNATAWPWQDTREMFNDMLGQLSLGMTFEQLRDKGVAYDSFPYRKYERGLLRPDGRAGFKTPTGKVELYSTVLAEYGLDPLPYYEEPPENPISTPAIAARYPLVLTTGARSRAFFHSEHRQVPQLRRLNPDPLIEIHPETAKLLGIEDGDWVYIENQHGRCRQKAKLTTGIDPRVVHAQHGWWFPEKKGPEPDLFGAWESNINLLLPGGWGGRAGIGYPFKCQMCRVYKVE